MTTLHEILERARAAQQRIPPGESAWLLAAAVRIAAARQATLRTRLVQLDAAGNMTLLPFPEGHPEEEVGYLAPELFGSDAPDQSEPRVQVYAAGALGYELLTGQPPPDPRAGAGREISGPLGDLVRLAMAKDRRERFATLDELRQAIESVQRMVGPDKERLAFGALVARSDKWGPVSELDRAAIGKLIEQVAHLTRQMDAVRSGMADVQRDQGEVGSRIAAFDSRLAKMEEGTTDKVSPTGRSVLIAGIAGGIAGAVLAAILLFSFSKPAVVSESGMPASSSAGRATGSAESDRRERPPAQQQAASGSPGSNGVPAAAAPGDGGSAMQNAADAGTAAR